MQTQTSGTSQTEKAENCPATHKRHAPGVPQTNFGRPYGYEAMPWVLRCVCNAWTVDRRTMAKTLIINAQVTKNENLRLKWPTNAAKICFSIFRKWPIWGFALWTDQAAQKSLIFFAHLKKLYSGLFSADTPRMLPVASWMTSMVVLDLLQEFGSLWFLKEG